MRKRTFKVSQILTGGKGPSTRRGGACRVMLFDAGCEDGFSDVGQLFPRSKKAMLFS